MENVFIKLTEKEKRQVLGKYLFRSQKANMKISDLSGGEKSRLVLAEILESRPNFLVLDEPTNHMDLPAKETMESAFAAYTGTMLFISHDRYFVSKVADALLLFEEDGVKYYPFGYEHYLHMIKEKKRGNPDVGGGSRSRKYSVSRRTFRCAIKRKASDCKI